jgi:hypothetical protein
VPARVSNDHFGFITTGGHKILPYDVMVFKLGMGATKRAFLTFSHL